MHHPHVFVRMPTHTSIQQPTHSQLMLFSRVQVWLALYSSTIPMEHTLLRLERHQLQWFWLHRLREDEGIWIANIVLNVQEFESGQGQPKKLKSYITFDDSSSWSPISPRLRSQTDRRYPATLPTLRPAPFTSTPSPILIILVMCFPHLLWVSSWVLWVSGEV